MRIINSVKYENKSVGNVKTSKIQEHINNKQKVLLTGPLTNGQKMVLSYLNSQYI